MQLQLIEVAIGVIAAFFLVSVMASAVVEIGSNLFRKRSKDLEQVIKQMLSSTGQDTIGLTETSVWKAAEIASRRKRGIRKGEKDRRTPSYLSARSFADGVIEGLVRLKAAGSTLDDVVQNLADGPIKSRLLTLRQEVGDDLVAIKAGIEGWFDDTMDRLEGAYKRWSQWLLLVVGLVFAFALNISTVRIIDALWNDPVLRTAIAERADDLAVCPADNPDCAPEEQIEQAIDQLDGLKLPVGWSTGWDDESGAGWTILGIIPTGLAVVLGAQFWFDLLTKLAGARGGRGVPPKAADEQGSATVEFVDLSAVRKVTAFSTLTSPP